jgi:3-carboxy-cis,cis-muconate cycloisomerase
MFDSSIFRDAFGAPAMRAIFSDEAIVARYVEVEVALAKAEARVGIIPAEAAATIARLSDAKKIDLAELKQKTEVVGYPIVGLVHQLAEQCGEAGGFVHWGATTQDIMDTATVLQVKAALALVQDDLDALVPCLANLAKMHRTTPMAGRTHLQHALPVTFGYKAAVWLSAVKRHRQRLEDLKPRALVGQLGGAAGTLASLGDSGLAVHDALMGELGLAGGPIPWHVARDGLAEAVCFLGLVTGTLSKIATDIMLMMQTELGEAFEPYTKGRGSSSTMPQKRNPIACEFVVALAKVVRQQVGLMLDGMAADFERATGPWQLEWVAIPEAFIATAGALAHTRFVLEGLVVDKDAMRRNLELTRGLIVAEAVMMALAEHSGRQKAHEIVAEASRAAIEGNSTLLAELERRADVTKYLDRAHLAHLTDPGNYLGSAPAMVDRVLRG